jgi:alpha-ketoglutarate-dependent taurine dioxygenase
VIKHPVSGRSILFVNPMHTHGFVGMTREEAGPLIEELAEHATQGRFVDYNDDSSAATRSLRRTTDPLSAR